MRMFNKRITCRLLACLLFFNCLPALLFAQGTQAIITGTVVDNKGESVIGATIQVKNESTGFFTGSITNDKGEYTIKQVSIHAPTRGATIPGMEYDGTNWVSIHAPTRGATVVGHGDSRVLYPFQSTHPHGVRHYKMVIAAALGIVSIHAPTRGATVCKVTYYKSIN